MLCGVCLVFMKIYWGYLQEHDGIGMGDKFRYLLSDEGALYFDFEGPAPPTVWFKII